jgi:hypothetical protein
VGSKNNSPGNGALTKVIAVAVLLTARGLKLLSEKGEIFRWWSTNNIFSSIYNSELKKIFDYEYFNREVNQIKINTDNIFLLLIDTIRGRFQNFFKININGNWELILERLGIRIKINNNEWLKNFLSFYSEIGHIITISLMLCTKLKIGWSHSEITINLMPNITKIILIYPKYISNSARELAIREISRFLGVKEQEIITIEVS